MLVVKPQAYPFAKYKGSLPLRRTPSVKKTILFDVSRNCRRAIFVLGEMAMLSQAHKCFTSSFFHSSCTRATYLRNPLRTELAQSHSRRTCGRLLVTASETKKSWGAVAQSDEKQRMLQVVLVSPQIPGNTGCIARTCAATCVGLHLVEPMGFKVEDSKLKRAGLDYWPYVVVKIHKSWNDFFTYFQEQEGEKRLLAFTKKGRDTHTDVRYKPGDWLLFGSEVDGLPPAALEQCSTGEFAGGTVRLPMNETYVRSLNLSVSAGVGVYEALRQLDAHTNYSTLDKVEAVSGLPELEPVLTRHNDGYP